MTSGSSGTGYIGYAIALWLITGLIILMLDVKGYRKLGQTREMKVSIFLGWFNLVLGGLALIGKTLLDWFGS